MSMPTSKIKSTMKEYVFYTTEGTALSPNQMEVENCQILSFERADRFSRTLLLRNMDFH